MLCQLKSCQLVHKYKKKSISKIGELPSSALKVIRIAANQQAISHFLLVDFCNKSIFFLHSFRDITIFAVFMTASNLEKSFTFDNMFEIINHVQFLSYVKTSSAVW